MTRLGTYGRRVGWFGALGLLAAVMTNVCYWNWYSSPSNYTVAYMFMQWVGFVLAGLVIAWCGRIHLCSALLLDREEREVTGVFPR